MQYKTAIPPLVLCFFFYSMVHPQSVLYSSTFSNDINTSFEVIGKAGNFYWLHKSKKTFTEKRGIISWPPRIDRSFEVYDQRLQRVNEIPNPISDSVVKQYLIAQRTCFDQLVFKKAANKTSVVVNRFTENGDSAITDLHLFDFPVEMALEDILITRSPDQTKILLLGFVRSTDVAPQLYARVYTKDWKLLHETVDKAGNLLQPFIQYDLTEYVLEASDASPLKLTNKGDWLMVASARLRNSFVLCHFKMEDSSFVQLDVKQPTTAGIEYCSLSVEEGKEAYIGILENLTPADKRVRIIQYGLSESRFDNDTSYRFHLPNSYRKQERYQFEEKFVQVPGKGFMYMKEYGRRYFIDNWGEKVMLDNEQEYAAYGAGKAKLKYNKNEYLRNNNFSDTKKRFDRGDLSVKYFPFRRNDSCWGGLLHVEQATQLRYDNLSYACVSSKDKIIFLYNSLAANEHKVSSTTVLDNKGQAMDEGIIFWRSAYVLNFQKARPVNPGELFVPFDRKGFQGFAIIHF